MNKKAVYNILLATVLFGVMNVFIKWLTGIPSYEIVFFRSVVSLVITLGFLIHLKINPFGKKNRFFLVLRGLAGSAALLLFFYTIQNLPLATAVTIQYLSPIFTIIFTAWIVKESINWRQWIYFLIAFSGVVVIKGFDARVSVLMLSLGVLAAIFSAIAYTAVRSVREKEHALVIVFYLPLSTIPIITPYTMTHWVKPIGIDWILLLGVGVLTQLAQYFMTRAYQLEKVGNVTPFTYTGIIVAIIFGLIFFNESYNVVVVLGILLVLSGVVLNYLYVNRITSAKRLKVFVRNWPGF